MSLQGQTKVEYASGQVRGLIVFVALLLGISIGVLLTVVFNSLQNNRVETSNSSNLYDSAFFESVYREIQNQYIGELPSYDELTYGTVKGLISSLNDPYTFFLDPEESKAYYESRNPDFFGIGVTLKFEDNNTEIETVLTGYPAERNGLKSGDVILSVNDEAVEGLQANVVASKIRGEKDTEVKLKLYRPSTASLFEITAVRESINVSNITYTEKDGIYHIRISQFIDESVEEFNRSWDKIVDEISSKNNIKGIVVDLRNNPGGYVSSVKYVIEEFLKNGQTMMFEETRSSGRIEFKDFRQGKFENIAVSVIVNQGSASASEIFAAAIQDNDRGEVVGMPTVGKGVEQTIINDFPDNSILVLVFQKWLTPSGRNIDKSNPIKPDYQLEISESDVANSIDSQLNRAIEELGL